MDVRLTIGPHVYCDTGPHMGDTRLSLRGDIYLTPEEETAYERSGKLTIIPGPIFETFKPPTGDWYAFLRVGDGHGIMGRGSSEAQAVEQLCGATLPFLLALSNAPLSQVVSPQRPPRVNDSIAENNAYAQSHKKPDTEE